MNIARIQPKIDNLTNKVNKSNPNIIQAGSLTYLRGDIGQVNKNRPEGVFETTLGRTSRGPNGVRTKGAFGDLISKVTHDYTGTPKSNTQAITQHGIERITDSKLGF